MQGVEIKELFTWAHGDGGPSAEPAPEDGGIGMYYIGKEKKFVRFDELDAELKHMSDVLWCVASCPP